MIRRLQEDRDVVCIPCMYTYTHVQMIRRLQEDRDVVLFCDLHGHSRKPNVFCYGCEQQRSDRRFVEMIFPRLLWRNCPVFSFSDCSFKVQRSKESTLPT